MQWISFPLVVFFLLGPTGSGKGAIVMPVKAGDRSRAFMAAGVEMC